MLDTVGWATERFLEWRRLGNDSIEGQLVRLASNVVRFLAVAWILIAAADSFGVPTARKPRRGSEPPERPTAVELRA